MYVLHRLLPVPVPVCRSLGALPLIALAMLVACSSSDPEPTASIADGDDAAAGSGSTPGRANEAPETKGGIEVAEGTEVDVNDCISASGKCDEPREQYFGSVVDGSISGSFKGVGTRFYSISLEQAARGVFNDNLKPMTIRLVSPEGANYDLIAYGLTNCQKIGASNDDVGDDVITLSPEAIDAGDSFTVIIEVRYKDGVCARDAEYTVQFRS